MGSWVIVMLGVGIGAVIVIVGRGAVIVIVGVATGPGAEVVAGGGVFMGMVCVDELDELGITGAKSGLSSLQPAVVVAPSSVISIIGSALLARRSTMEVVFTFSSPKRIRMNAIATGTWRRSGGWPCRHAADVRAVLRISRVYELAARA
jgi:hypothetical protein